MLEELDEEALVQILTKPKNAITKQYSRLFEMDGIELDFEPEALKEVAASIALKKKTGARGLRSILEQSMLDVMFDIPSNDKINKVVVTLEAIREGKRPRLEEGLETWIINKKLFQVPRIQGMLIALLNITFSDIKLNNF